MSTQELEADYLVVGSGAMGLAFIDELLNQNKSTTIIVVDQRAKPGGHWNEAYPFVSLHQPAAYYGVNSLPLGRGGSDLASGDEVLAYFDQSMKKMLKTGRLQYFPMCKYQGKGRFKSIVASNKQYQVNVNKKIVDATYMNVEVPSTTPPKYDVEPGVKLVPPNDLARVSEPKAGYVIIGAGKTGIDAILFLLDKGVAPDTITWIMPNDSWFLDRSHIEPGQAMKFYVSTYEEIVKANSLNDLFLSIEARGSAYRIDNSVWPEKFRCATISQAELAQLKRITNIVRQGRVQRVELDKIVLQDGILSTSAATLHVDCTANPLSRRPIVRIFNGPLITLQSVSLCQQVFSAALIAYVESKFQEDEAKNSLCGVVPHPEVNRDYLLSIYQMTKNILAWERPLGLWLLRSRLYVMHHEPLFELAYGGLRLRRLLKPSLASLSRMIEQEFPNNSLPTGDICLA